MNILDLLKNAPAEEVAPIEPQIAQTETAVIPVRSEPYEVAEPVEDLPGYTRPVTGEDVRSILTKIGSPEAVAANQEKYAKYGKESLIDHFANILSLTPRGGRFGSLIRNSRGQKAKRAKEDLDMSLDAAKTLESQRIANEQLEIQKAQESRSATKEGIENENAARAAYENRKTDSPVSLVAQHMLGKLNPDQLEIISKMPAEQINMASPLVKEVYNSINARKEAEARLEETRASRMQTGQQQTASREQAKELSDRAFMAQQDEKQAKKNSARREIDERANNMLRAVNAMQDMIGGPVGPDGKRSGGKGTAEFFGPHEEILKGYINDVATEYSKMLDPDTGVRDPEVVRFMSTTFKPGNPLQRDKTAVDLLENFKQKIQDRKAEAYRRHDAVATPSDSNGNSGNKTSAEIIKREISPSTGKIRITRSDGSTEIIDANRQ